VTGAVQSRRSKRQALKSLRQVKRLSYATAKLLEWQEEARRRARLLNADMVWAMVKEFQEEATALGLVADLRDVCFMAAGRMADPRGLKLTVRYSKHGKEEPAEYAATE
jgi:hypothetical protein